jgi:hypothetical protein
VTNGGDSAVLPLQAGNTNGDIYFATVDVSVSDVISISADGATSFNTIGGILIGDATGFISPLAPNPTLTIDRDTGLLTLENNTDSSLDIVAYEILSAVGALKPGNGSWTSIADSDSSWIEFTAASDRDNLAEGQQPGGSGNTFANGGAQIGLGNAWLPNPTEDVTMQLGLADNTLIPVDVIFTGNGNSPFAIGDFNLMDGVNVADWNLFKTFFGSDTSGLSTAEAYRAGDMNHDDVVNLLDANAFAVAFDAANGAGAFAAAITAVPEPNSIALILLGVTILGYGRGLGYNRRQIR